MPSPRLRLQWRGRFRAGVRDAISDITNILNYQNKLVSKGLPLPLTPTQVTALDTSRTALEDILTAQVLR